MFIRDEAKTFTSKFHELDCGDVFRYNNFLFLKVSMYADESNAYGLLTKKLTEFPLDEVVEPLSAELAVHPRDWKPIRCSKSI